MLHLRRALTLDPELAMTYVDLAQSEISAGKVASGMNLIEK